MYLFYLDESGSRDPSVGSLESPKDDTYVLLAVGLYEGQWRRFDRELSSLKLDLINDLYHQGKGHFNFAECEVKSRWIRLKDVRKKESRFFGVLGEQEVDQLSKAYLSQLLKRHAVVFAVVIDKNYLHDHFTHETMHIKAYELLLERIQRRMERSNPRHNALIVVDDTGVDLNRSTTMSHASYLLQGNKNTRFSRIIEYPFFTPSEFSNGVQLADLLVYNVYRAFKYRDLNYPFFKTLLPYFDRDESGINLVGLKIWPERSPLVSLAKEFWKAQKLSAPQAEGAER